MATSGLIRTGFVLFGDADNPIDGVSDVMVTETAEGIILTVASEARSAVSVFDISDPGAITLTGRIDYGADSGTRTISGLLSVPTPGGDRLLTLARYDDAVRFYDIDASGTVFGGEAFAVSGVPFAQVWVADSFSYGTSTMVYFSQFGVAGVQVARISSAGDIVQLAGLTDTDWRRLGDVTAIEHGYLHGQDVIFTASAFDSGLHSFSIRSGGGPRGADRLLPREGEGFARVTDIAEVQIGDRAFIVVAGSQSDTLTVVRVSQGLQMNVVDQVRDTLELRIEGVQAVEVFQWEGRTFVVAGGADDGISLFEMTYRGQLVHLDTIADGFDTTLRNVSSLDVRVAAGQAHVYVGSAAEHGVTELVIDLSRSGDEIRGGAVAETLTGTAGDDVIWGMGRSDVLIGGAGDDRLIDGRGRDTLTGGEGADVFVFTDDGRSDFITDFEIGVDRIDLSDFDYVNHISDLHIATRKGGAVIIVGDEVIRLIGPDGGPLDVSDIGADSFIFG